MQISDFVFMKNNTPYKQPLSRPSRQGQGLKLIIRPDWIDNSLKLFIYFLGQNKREQ